MQLINSEVRIENTNACNASCSICAREKMTRQITTMPLPRFGNIVDQAKNLGAETISIFGYGEPLLDKEISDKVEYCSIRDLETFITTNASLLYEDMAERLLENGLNHIRFSVHALYPNAYNNIHKGLNFYNVFSKILNFIYLNEKYNHPCKISISVIPMHGETVDEIVKFWEPMVNWLEIWKPHNWVYGRAYRDKARVNNTCFRPFTGPLQINADGKVMVCCFDFDAKMIVGDTKYNTLEEILKGEIYKSIRKSHEIGLLSHLPCAGCDQLNNGDNPLLYSNRDKDKTINCTSSTKFKLEGDK